jgi:hypothetical protein
VGQIGSELVDTLRKRWGMDNVIASDVKPPHDEYPTGLFGGACSTSLSPPPSFVPFLWG